MAAEILDIPEVRERVSRLSVEEYHRLDEFNEHGKRTELIRGIVIEKMSKSPQHRCVSSKLYRWLLNNVPQGYSVWKEEPLTCVDSEPEPDISVVRGVENDFANAHPTTAELVIEVAISSPALDRANATLYAEAEVKEYWIIIPAEQSVEVYRKPLNGRYQEQRVFRLTEVVDCGTLPEIRLHVADLFA